MYVCMSCIVIYVCMYECMWRYVGRDAMEAELRQFEDQVRDIEDQIRLGPHIVSTANDEVRFDWFLCSREHNRESSMTNGRVNVAHARKKVKIIVYICMYVCVYMNLLLLSAVWTASWSACWKASNRRESVRSPHTYINAYIHAYMHTYIHTYMCP